MMIPTEFLRAAQLFAAKKDVRFYLCGVCLEWHRSEARLIATDGHRMFVARFAIDWDDAHESGAIIIPSDAVKRALTGYKDAVAELEIDNGYSLAGVTFTPIDGTFPDWRRVVPVEASGEIAQYNASYVGELGKAARALLSRSVSVWCQPAEGRVHIHHNGMDGALVTFGARNDCCAVLMPMRSDESSSDALNHAALIAAPWTRGGSERAA